MPTQREKIIRKSLEILENRHEGIRYSGLFREIKNSLPEVPENTIHGTIWDLNKKVPQIAKPERGLFILKKYLREGIEKELRAIEDKVKTAEKIIQKEENFYQPFADYLVNDLEECTKAIPLGGNKFGDKWGTPDVFGIYKFSETEPLRPPIEIISAEIKIDTNQLVAAFGQACSYKLFSHKVYLVVPKGAERDVGRVESLCSRFGIGLILFDKRNLQNPNFEIRTRAIKSEPDYFYVNEYLRRLGRDSKKLF
jgi:hypothetical protein